jgi:tRNA-2-methylthio-N6-dimethylallyladenosine synthase
VLPVLLDRPGRHPGQLIGRSPYLQSVHVRVAVERNGDIVMTRITGAGQNSLSGAPISCGISAEAGAA